MPAVQGRHVVAPSFGAYLPTGQLGQTEWLCASAAVPRAQGVQLALLVAPSLG